MRKLRLPPGAVALTADQFLASVKASPNIRRVGSRVVALCTARGELEPRAEKSGATIIIGAPRRDP
jgi:hypothetical protein